LSPVGKKKRTQRKNTSPGKVQAAKSQHKRGRNFPSGPKEKKKKTTQGGGMNVEVRASRGARRKKNVGRVPKRETPRIAPCQMGGGKRNPKSVAPNAVGAPVKPQKKRRLSKRQDFWRGVRSDGGRGGDNAFASVTKSQKKKRVERKKGN